jgi:hypothetical protein
VSQAFSIRSQAVIAFPTGDKNLDLSSKPCWAVEIVSIKRLFQPINAGLLERLGRG